MRNEFMAAWDGLSSKDNQRILILSATNRPFVLDDAVIRRLLRRIYMDLPDTENRMKDLKICSRTLEKEKKAVFVSNRRIANQVFLTQKIMVDDLITEPYLPRTTIKMDMQEGP
ncbi:hypothetical protein Droror1_Dr00022583 [Drosera rotundifolia]